MKPVFRLLFVTLPIAALGAGYLAYQVTSRPPPEQVALAERPTHVSVVETRLRTVRPVLRGFGRVAPARMYSAISEVAGTAEYVNPGLHQGEILLAGTVLVRIAETDFRLAIAQSQSAIRGAEAKLAELDAAELNYMASLAIERETLAIRESDLARVDELVTRGSAPEANRDAARASVLAQRIKVQSIQGSLEVLPAQRAALSEQIVAARLNLEQAELNLSRTELTLPYAARVSMVDAEIGQYVRAGTIVAKLDGIDAAEITAQVGLSALRAHMRHAVGAQLASTFDMSALNETIRHMNMDATVTLRLGEEVVTWEGKLDRLADSIDPRTATVGVIVRVEDAYGAMQPGNRPPLTEGMFVEVALTGPHYEAIVVPRTSLRDGAVFVSDKDSRLQRVPISLHFVQGDMAVVKDGLGEGVEVLTVPVRPAIEGMLLETHPDMTLMATLNHAEAEE